MHKLVDTRSNAMRIERLLAELKQFLKQLETVKNKDIPQYKQQCESMIDLAGEIDAILRDE